MLNVYTIRSIEREVYRNSIIWFYFSFISYIDIMIKNGNKYLITNFIINEWGFAREVRRTQIFKLKAFI